MQLIIAVDRVCNIMWAVLLMWSCIVQLVYSHLLQPQHEFLRFVEAGSHESHLAKAAAAAGDDQLSYPVYGFIGSVDLSQGFNLSIDKSFNLHGTPIKDSAILTTGTVAFNHSFFLPFLSSPSFNSANSSQSLGFSLGFLISKDQSIYLAVCGGLSGNYSQVTSAFTVNYIEVSASDGGFAVPMWIANQDRPLTSRESSLVVVPASGSLRELQLRDGDGTVVWKVSNVGMMEIQDHTGHLLIYDSIDSYNRTVVWKSSDHGNTSTLLQGQRLMVGMELKSNDYVYSARMEKGGLVLYLSTAQFTDWHPAPYLIFYFLYRNTSMINTTLNQLVSSSPCSSPNDTAYIMLRNASLELYLEPGSCSLQGSLIYGNSLETYADPSSILWSFLRLENDGKLYVYAVFKSMSAFADPTQTFALDSAAGYNLTDLNSEMAPVFSWQECQVPMACGPLGVCTPGVHFPCSCPSSDSADSFALVDRFDFSKGCKRFASLPPCTSGGHEHISTTQFLQLNQTATIFLFSGWEFNSTSAPVEKCRKSCSSDCSCHGFFYQAPTSSCFFMTDEITLLTINDITLTHLNISDPQNITMVEQKVFGRDYVMYLKVTSAAAGSTNKTGAAAGGTNNKTVTIVLSAVIASLVACLVLGGAVYSLASARNRKHIQLQKQAQEAVELQDVISLMPSRFSYQDLHQATRGFTKLLGSGGCGSVYAGILSDGRKVAVKILEILLKGGQSKQFLAEIATIGRTNHLNIVRLIGFCWEGEHRLLVYEYVERGPLDRWLFVNKGATQSASKYSSASAAAPAPPMLDWHTRYNIALGIARGLSYLHEECAQPILHFDIKPQNILLDDGFTAKLADFGMSRLMQEDTSQVLTGVRGTIGYIAPEWLSHGLVSKKVDIYSLGMVMLEIVSGRRNLDLQLLNSALDSVEQEAWHFPSWAANKCEQGLMMDLLDKRLHTFGFDADELERLIHTAFWCIQQDPGLRPYAPTVVHWLEGTAPIKKPPFSITTARTESKIISASL